MHLADFRGTLQRNTDRATEKGIEGLDPEYLALEDIAQPASHEQLHGAFRLIDPATNAILAPDHLPLARACDPGLCGTIEGFPQAPCAV